MCFRVWAGDGKKQVRAVDVSRERVTIVLGLYNGAADLGEQLESLAAQDHGLWDLRVGDDGSSDAGPEIVQAFSRRMEPAGHRITLHDGPGRGFAVNFLTLIGNCPDETRWLAFCDQDDVWLPDRLSRGLRALADMPPDHPALYCSRTLITDERLKNRRPSAPFLRPPGFRNALVQNIAAGNTILVNPAGAALLRAEALKAAEVPKLAAHDWWAYQLITGAGGTVIHDPEPTLLYRQHPDNLIGANDGWRARGLRLQLMMKGKFAEWNVANLAALERSADRLTPEHRALVAEFQKLRNAPISTRIQGFLRLRLYRQGALGRAAFWLSVLIGKI